MVRNKYGFILTNRYAHPTRYACIEGHYAAYYESPNGEYGIMCETKPSGNPEGNEVVEYSVFRMDGNHRVVEKYAKSQKAAFEYLKTVGVETEKLTIYNILTNCTDGWEKYYDDYVEFCESNDLEPAEKNSVEYWKWVDEEIETNIECDLKNMKFSKIRDNFFVVTGCIGRWDGTPTIRPKVVRGLKNLIEHLWGSGDRHFRIDLDTKRGIITSRIWHHDDPTGKTQLEARMLNRNGMRWLEAAEYRYEEADIQLNNRWWTKITDIGMIY